MLVLVLMTDSNRALRVVRDCGVIYQNISCVSHHGQDRFYD